MKPLENLPDEVLLMILAHLRKSDLVEVAHLGDRWAALCQTVRVGNFATNE